MPHGQCLEEVASIEAPFTVISVVLGMFEGHLETWETRSEDNSCSVSGVLWHLPVSNKAQTAFPDLFNRSQRNRCIPESKQTRCHPQLSGDVPCEDDFRIDAKFFCKVERTFDPSELWHITEFCRLVHVDRAIAPFDEAD